MLAKTGHFFALMWFALVHSYRLFRFIIQARPTVVTRPVLVTELEWTKQVLAYISVMQLGGVFTKSLNAAQQVAIDILRERGYTTVDHPSKDGFQTFGVNAPVEQPDVKDALPPDGTQSPQ